MTREATGGRREAGPTGWPGFLLAAGLSAAVAAAAIARHEPRDARPVAGPSGFSAVGAREILSRLLGDGSPHPIGSLAHAEVRARVVAELAKLGIEPAVQRAFACGDSGACATVENVLARLPGRAAGKALLLCAHYDSVGAGPGASDDGMGVAVMLEVARVLRSEGARRNAVLLLIDDGEEAGLLGASAFAREHPWAREVGAVVNLEARGTSGPSLLFETSEDNQWLIRAAAAALPHPHTSSIFYTIYKWLPNDTDLTVFRRFGMAGVNFAHIGDVAHYHTPLDNFENASPATLQEHGDHVLAMARALAQADLTRPHRGNAVYFDLFGAGILWWPEAATLPIAAAAALLLVAAIALALRRASLAPSEIAWGLLAGLLSLLLPIAAASLAGRAVKAAGVLPTRWIAHPAALLTAVWALASLAAWLPAALLARRGGWRGLWAGTWILWTVGALALARAEPALSILLLVPAVASGLAGVWTLARSGRANAVVAVSLPAAAAAFFWIPLAWLLYGALGTACAIIGGAVGFWAAAAAPALAFLPARGRRGVLLVVAAVVLTRLISALYMKPHDRQVPERIEIVRSQDADTGNARWLLFAESGQVSARQRRLGFAAAGPVVEPWSSNRPFAAPAPHLDLASPELVLRESSRDSSRRTLRGILRSARHAPVAFLALAPTTPLQSIALAGRPIALEGRALRWHNGWRFVSCLTTPAEGIDVEITVTGRSPVEIIWGDRSRGLAAAEDLTERLRGEAAVTSQDGDLTEVVRRSMF